MLIGDRAGCPLADDHAWCHRVAGGDAGHDRSVGHTKAFDPVDLEPTVDDCHRIAAHPGGPHLMPERHCRIAHIGFEFCALEVAWHYFTLDERLENRGITQLPHALHAGD